GGLSRDVLDEAGVQPEEWATLGRQLPTPAVRTAKGVDRTFELLGELFETWLTSGPRRRAGGLPVLWLQDQDATTRSAGLTACMLRALKREHPVTHVGSNFDEALAALQRSFDATPPELAWIVVVD